MLNYYSALGIAAAILNPLTGDTKMFWLIPAAAVSLILVVLLIIFGKKRPPSDD